MHTQNKPLQRLISIRPYTHSKQAKHTVPPINTQTIAPKVVCQNKAPRVIRPSTHSKQQRGYIPKHIQNKTPQIIYMYFYTYSKQNSTDGTSLSIYTQNKAREGVPPIHTQSTTCVAYIYTLKPKHHRRYVTIYTLKITHHSWNVPIHTL